MFLFDKNLLDALTTGGSKIPVGIHPACEVTSMDVEDTYIDFNYRDASGRTQNKRIWIPDMSKVTNPYKGKTIQETYEAKLRNAGEHIALHASVFLPKEVLESISAPTLKEYALKVKAVITPELSKKKVNLKVVPDQNGEWPTISGFASPAYIQLYEKGAEPTLAPVSQKDYARMKPVVSDTSNMKDDDLPF